MLLLLCQTCSLTFCFPWRRESNKSLRIILKLEANSINKEEAASLAEKWAFFQTSPVTLYLTYTNEPEIVLSELEIFWICKKSCLIVYFHILFLCTLNCCIFASFLLWIVQCIHADTRLMLQLVCSSVPSQVEKLQMQPSNAMHDNKILLSELDNAGMNIRINLEVDKIQAHLDKVSLEKADLRFQNGGLKLR